ncbi:hypothetical protein ColLi_05309 [Colletotrichum liriopes]|uniref:Uncharacterized protein n=1 Tax=Colletotrichum liriopes TaxID=708192 RepID=A0AA37GK26_9PEZI|nr:hypothetical protein ColLi_05309 [Colletotrichum liriopes]
MGLSVGSNGGEGVGNGAASLLEGPPPGVKIFDISGAPFLIDNSIVSGDGTSSYISDSETGGRVE